jgi:hypothetical protein
MNCSIFRKIMVATDGSEPAKKAVDTAIEISKLGEKAVCCACDFTGRLFFFDASFHRWGMGKGNGREC